MNGLEHFSAPVLDNMFSPHLHVLDVLLVPLGGHVVFAGLCHGHLVEHDEDEAVQEDGVKGHHQPRRLVARDEPDQGENHLHKRFQ